MLCDLYQSENIVVCIVFYLPCTPVDYPGQGSISAVKIYNFAYKRDDQRTLNKHPCKDFSYIYFFFLKFFFKNYYLYCNTGHKSVGHFEKSTVTRQ